MMACINTPELTQAFSGQIQVSFRCKIIKLDLVNLDIDSMDLDLSVLDKI